MIKLCHVMLHGFFVIKQMEIILKKYISPKLKVNFCVRTASSYLCNGMDKMPNCHFVFPA